ncbi:MAG: MerR family transcriptional regulator [Sulfurimicrobium sp.]|nr:MerR family transcriptional regulator [Sulfurimicrobium sp.]MDO9188322.1 MerR family transcriptional regulator [Sulfurimicrobium sp.]MDP1896722.1 MerR family transcriptional regulator [Sulfurimicrobium sp.]MDP2199057.1 MerR family transcriptional regulator [Sulfurimicrobium sp.]MDP2963878.1 MerR family transcriptional regulator [Sulfurimicrobium sp.]
MMYIGALAKLTGASRKAIHHYELLGLIPVPQRKGRYRIYNEVDAHLICIIKRSQTLGFSLKEITDVISTTGKTGKLPVNMVVELIERKREDLREIINSALSKDRQLAELQADFLCNSGETCLMPLDSSPKGQA